MDELAAARQLTDALDPYRAVDRTRARGESWVMGHMVAGIDGTAAVNGRVGALSTAPDQILFRRMRQLADVVLVGAQTVRRERYGAARLEEAAQRDRRARGMRPTPPIAVVSRSLRFDWSARVFAEAPAHARTVILTCADADPGRRRAAAEVADVVIAGQDRVEARRAVAALADLGHRVVLCEGGPTLLGQLAAAGRLDELCLSVAPVMGGDALPVAITPSGAGVTDFALRHVLAQDGTLFLRYEAAGPRDE